MWNVSALLMILCINNMKPMKAVQRFRIANMDCPGCASELQAGIEKLPGVKSALVDFASHTLHLEGEVALTALKQRVESFGKKIEPAHQQQTYRIGNMHCPGCAGEVEQAVRQLRGVTHVALDYVSETLELAGTPDFEQLRAQVEALGKTITPIAPATDLDEQAARRTGVLGFWAYLRGRQASRMALYGGALLLAAILIDLLTAAPTRLKNLSYALAMAVAMKPIAESGLNSLRINRAFNINLLMTIAAVGALFLGEFLEAATVIFLFAIGEALEGYTADRARDSLRGLVAMIPLTAHLLERDQTRVVPVEQLRIGDWIRVLPGERIPMDGTVMAGVSAVDQAHITGESLPAEVMPGAEVYAGSINGEAVLVMRVSRISADNTLSRIIVMLQEAQARRAPSQRLIDQFARVYTPAVALAALAVALVPPIIFGQPFWDSAAGTGWLYRGLAMLVIACPCALVISTPVTVISAITAAARRGVLIKGGAHLETLAGIKALAFDKTGTLTKGRLDVVATYTDECADERSCPPCRELLAMAAAVEGQSTHPFAAAIMHAAAEQAAGYQPASDVQNLTGRGIQGLVNGRSVTIGSHSYFENAFAHSARLCEVARETESDGKSAVMVHDGDRVRGVIALADSVREESRRVVSELHGLGLACTMLTGDNSTVAASIAQQVGVDISTPDCCRKKKSTRWKICARLITKSA